MSIREIRIERWKTGAIGARIPPAGSAVINTMNWSVDAGKNKKRHGESGSKGAKRTKKQRGADRDEARPAANDVDERPGRVY